MIEYFVWGTILLDEKNDLCEWLTGGGGGRENPHMGGAKKYKFLRTPFLHPLPNFCGFKVTLFQPKKSVKNIFVRKYISYTIFAKGLHPQLCGYKVTLSSSSANECL